MTNFDGFLARTFAVSGWTQTHVWQPSEAVTTVSHTPSGVQLTFDGDTFQTWEMRCRCGAVQRRQTRARRR